MSTSEWIAWHGGEPPIRKGTRHFAKYRDGGVAPQDGGRWSDRAWNFYWRHVGNDDDIIAYQVVEQAA